ncbi:MAG: zinc-binding dehydrogenase [Deltaproteobacteria bacterium]|nr:zinc-binding dehydrogenase [Deltaproteobacteria bacterium]
MDNPYQTIPVLSIELIFRSRPGKRFMIILLHDWTKRERGMTEKIRAARFYGVGEPLRIDKIPVSKLGPGDVLVEMKACGICGSDIHIVYEGVTPTAYTPITLGHEPSGVIFGVGSEVRGWKIGDRVTINPFLTCDQCVNCLSGNSQICLSRRVVGIHTEGGLAEFIKVPAKNLISLPENIPFDQGGIMVDAVATPFHAITNRGGLKAGEKVAIFGCGGLGIHGVQIAKVCGASQVIAVDAIDSALERVKKVGADEVINPQKGNPSVKIKELTGGMGVDLALEFVGLKETIDQAVQCVRVGGRVVVVGLGPDEIILPPPTQVVRSELSFLGSYGSTTLEIQNVVDLVASGKLNLSGSITGRYSLEEVNRGLEQLYKKIGNPIRIVIEMN